jgi:hypothetical protein
LLILSLNAIVLYTDALFVSRARFDALLRAMGWLAMDGQIIDATVIEERLPHLTQAEKDTIRGYAAGHPRGVARLTARDAGNQARASARDAAEDGP